MDEYDKKFAEMQKYIPFLEAMIERLQNVKDKSREIQLQKMQSLHGILSNSKRKLRIETLQRCEDVLQKLHNRVEKGNAPGLQLPTKRNDGSTSQPSTSSEEGNLDQSKKTEESLKSGESVDKDKFEETPASPDPSVSPDSRCQILPIIIPTERNTDFTKDESNREESGSRIPVITIVERPGTVNILSSDSNHSDDVVFTEWDMLEESQRHNTKTKGGGDWQSLTASGHDVASAAKLVSSNLPQKVNNNDSRSYAMGSCTDIPTVPVPSLGGSRRLSSVLEKTKILNIDINTATAIIRPESPVNVPEVRLKSPDPEILFPRSKVLSPKSKDSHGSPRTPTKTPMPLLVSPPPISNEPPLSMEDLEELLGDGDEKKGDRKGEKKGEDIVKHKKDSVKQQTNLTKDNKKEKELSLSYLAAERESEKQWEEVDKHIIKLSGRKCTSNVINATSAMIAKIENKSNEIKGPPDHRPSQSPSTSSKFEPRYADNYERHPRQRDVHSHENVKEKPAGPENMCRAPDQEVIPILHNPVSGKVDERIGMPLYQRRPSAPIEGWKDITPSRTDNEFLIEGTDYYNMHMNQSHWPMPSSVASGDLPFGNAQWTPANYSGMPNPPIPPYPHPMGMFMGGSPVDHTAAGPRPLLNSPARSQDVNHAMRPEKIREEIPPLMSTNVFSPQYRGFQMGQGSYDPAFDRSAEYPHVRPTWEGSAGRVNEPSYNNDNVIPLGINISETSTGVPYSRSDTPCPWTRDRNRVSRGRGRESYYNERNRTEVRPNFNRDIRRPDRPRDNLADRENPNRFNRDSRNMFERDPRVRVEHNATIPIQAKETSSSSSASIRDPRLAKDRHFSPTRKDATHNERDPRKRSLSSVTSPTSAPTPLLMTSKKITSNKEKSKPQKLSEKRADSESSKEKIDKLPKAENRMQSPLESLYGAIDTKSSHAGGLQKFKIPKIKRPEPPQPPSQPSSTTSHVVDEPKETGSVISKSSRNKSDSKKKSHLTLLSENLDKDDAIAEVSSTSNGSNVIDSSDGLLPSKQDDITREDEIISSLVEETNKKKASMLSAKSIEIMKKNRKGESEADGTKSKDEVTQEWIEALIRKSFECGEGKKLVEHAKLIQKLGEALQAKKLKKIQKIIESESESSSSDKDETIGPKKTLTRKRRVIVSDSSDDECLAERLSILNTSVELDDKRIESVFATSMDAPDSTKHSAEDKIDKTASDRLSEKLAKSIGSENDGPSENLNEKSIGQTEDKIGELETSNSRLKENNKQNDIAMKDYNDDNNEKSNLQLEGSPGNKRDRLGDNNESINNCAENDKQRSQLEDEKKDETEDQQVNVDLAFAEKAQDIELIAEKAVEVLSDKPKPKTKRRNSLEMLQEDIRDMFISDEVVTATGFRMCRLPKENQLPSGSTGTNSKKDEASNTSVRESSVEIDEPITNSAKFKKTSSKSRNSSGESKSKSKSKKDLTQRQARTKLRSKESVLSSDSEEDQPLALRTERKLSNNSSNTPRREEDEESSDMLRKSKRMLNKEPRVLVEKTDITKLDLSKVMFDSSSDESFSIDVSELAAAVDISLRPDKHSDQDSVDTVMSSKPQQRPTRSMSKRNSKPKRKRSASLLNDCKSDDGMSFTDESVISDISISSSMTVGATKRRSTRTVKEDLLSNILVGLVPTEKSTIDNKDDEADIEEDFSCPSPLETAAKKSSTKKKKKKSNWQLGILSKKKKKKTASATSSKASPADREEISNEASASMDNVENSLSVSGDTNVTMAETTLEKTVDKEQLVDDASVNSSLKCESVVQQSANSDVAVDHHTESNNLTILLECSTVVEEEKSSNEPVLSHVEKKSTLKATTKVDTKEAKAEEEAGTDEAKAKSTVTTEPNTNVQTTGDVSKLGLSTIVYDVVMEEVFHDLHQRLIEYAWTGQDKYKCQLCFFSGKNIVHHYKIVHPNKEILIARLRPVDAETAILDAEKGVEDKATSSSMTTCKYRCRFCWFETEGAADIALEAFYEHCTTHTGEYRFHCRSCTYKAVAKASMRTHYYKMCRKLNDTFYEAIIEDSIPRGNGVYGYLCCECNYVQLKRENVEAHVKFWHRDMTDTKILKINMSMSTARGATSGIQESQECGKAAKEPFDEEIKKEVKPQVSEIEDTVPKDTLMDAEMDTTSRATDIGATDKLQDKSDDECDKSCDLQETQANDEMEQETDARLRTSVQGEPEGPVNTGNMSVFVCPPELENKEVEIQLERKKRMQEIVENIGIKINKNLSKSSLSIIDKLQDKMRTDAVANLVNENNESANISQRGDDESVLTNVTDSIVDSSKHEENVIINENPLSQPTTDPLEIEDPLAEQSIDGKSDTTNSDNTDKADVKIRDPLAIMDSSKNSESDGDISDAETVQQRSPVYESDSSSEQSDSEPTDVNMILKETSSINASSSRAPMLTTIQRLAAQLKGAKPLELSAAKDIKSEPVSPTSKMPFPKAPSVISIADAKTASLLNQDVKDDKDCAVTSPTSNSDDSTPKNFLRLRRLSGDMLSLPVSDNQEDTQASSTDGTQSDSVAEVLQTKSDSVAEVSQTQSDSTTEVLQTDTEEECSFLKIENVVSLAPSSENNETESPIINDIRKAVEISPVKNKSLLKKAHQPLILKKMNLKTHLTLANNVPVIQPSTSDTMTLIPVSKLNQIPISTKAVTTHLTTNFMPIHPLPPKTIPKAKIITLENTKVPIPRLTSSVKTPTPMPTNTANCKIFKMLRTTNAPTTIDPKNHVSIASFMAKLKSTDAYWAMLRATKLIHFYKCMCRDCNFTTDSITLFCHHYNQHCEDAKKQKVKAPCDYQKCVYCSQLMLDWNDVRIHMWEKHSCCRFQCGYCFYRAAAACYVHQHQLSYHPNTKFYMLVGKMGKDISKQENKTNRSKYVLPYMCNEDCGKTYYIPESFILHLKSTHSSKPSSGFKCHLCKSVFNTLKMIIIHYKSHGIDKYQCLYCLYGSENPTEMLEHLSVCHCNQLPQILERALPSVVMNSEDVLSNLIIRTYNESGQFGENVQEPNNSAASAKEDALVTDTVNVQISGSTMTILTYKDPITIQTALNQEGTSILNTTQPNFLETLKLDDAEVAASVPSIITAEQTKDMSLVDSVSEDNTTRDSIKSSTKQNSSQQLLPDELLLSKPNENKPVQILQKNKPTNHVRKQVFNESALLDDSNAMDPLEFCDDLTCPDEFINTNLLDNLDFLKSLTASSSNASFCKDDIAISCDKTEDSDIEILENVENLNVAEKKSAENDANQTTEPESSKQTIEKEEQSELYDATEDKDTSNETVTNLENATSRPLTLEDIKDTGFTGLDLYKCGYEQCDFAATAAPLLKKHVKECSFSANDKNLNCAHCKKRFIKIGFLLEHLKIHGLKRFGCSLCKVRYPVSYQATAHMKTKHKFPNTKLVPADPTNPSVDGLFIVQAIRFGSGERKTKKRRGPKLTESEIEKAAMVAMDNEKLSFSPDDIDQLPRQAIYIREVQCAVCPYTTKVRTNIIRHLQLHAKDQTVPETGPVNPVPCLDKKERMFDKMVNLASSSHQNGRMGAKPKETVKDVEENAAIPKFVPEHKRYVCGVAECNYLTVDEAMLRYHLKALHSEEPYFRCPHCPPPSSGQESQNIAIDKMGVHLKMHDARLYKCSHCNHHHYQRYVVERHLTDKHPEKRPFVKVIRELDNTENTPQPAVQEETEEEVPDPDGNHWKCNLCDFKCAYKAEMSTHAATVHDEKCQYKCAVCSFKTSGKILFEQHISSKHAYDPNVDFVLVYQRIRGVNKRNTEVVEQSGQDEPFDTTPLWRRDMPRIRHIRGILLEEENETPSSEVSTMSSKGTSLGKRKSETELSKASKVKMAKSASFDENKQCKEKSKRSLSCEAEGDGQNTKETKSDLRGATNKTAEDAKRSATELNDTNDSDVGRFGPYGKPDGNMYICTLCNQFKTKYKHDMRDHLYRELNYARWHCKACGYLSVNRNALIQHFTKHHNGERPDHEPLSPDNAIEDWVATLLKKQTDMIKAASQKVSVISKNPTMPSIKPITTPEVINPTKTTNTDTKTVNLATAITNLQNDILQNTDRNVDELDDGDSRDDEDLVIDIKEDELDTTDKSLDTTSENDKSFEKDEPEVKLICKHCNMKFYRRRGFKLHVQLTHLKRLGYLCPYCDRSTNSEQMIRQHIRAKHRDREMKIVHNPAAGGPELTNEFWEKEYGLVCPKVKKKRKASVDDTKDDNKGSNKERSEGGHDVTCEVCGFAAANYTGLKSHMRAHMTKYMRCPYCTYSCSIRPELVEHWQVNHSHLPFKITYVTSGSGESSGNGSPQAKKRNIDMYTDDIEEEQIESLDEDEINIKVYYCVYCNERSRSLVFLMRHWNLMHKEQLGNASNASPTATGGLPFKYRECQMPAKIFKREQMMQIKSQKKKLTELKTTKNAESPRDFVRQLEENPLYKDGSSDAVAGQGWICQWCQELCETDNDMQTHQNMFHSHLPSNFKKQQQQGNQTKFVCTVCSFSTTFYAMIKKHVIKHVNLFKCKYCEQSFSTPVGVSAHSSEKHLGLPTKIESISNFESVVDNLIKRVKQSGAASDGDDAVAARSDSNQNSIRGVVGARLVSTGHAVARKSTTKSVISYIKPGPRTYKAVARKSTNPLPKYLREGAARVRHYSLAMKTESDEETKSVQLLSSHYGIPSDPINLAKVSTYMMLGGHSMRVNCTTLAQLININPKVMLKDVKYDPVHAKIFSQYV